MKIALLFRSYGPYHLARLDAARSRHSVLALECFDIDADYDWQVTEQKRASGIITLSESPLKLAESLRNELKRFRPSAVAIPGYSEVCALTALGVCRALGIPTILMSDTYRQSARRGALRDALKSNVVSLFSAAFVAGSPHAEYLAGLGFPSDRITVGYDVVDNSHFGLLAKKQQPRPSDVPARNYFFCCARLVEKKNLALLIEAFGRYRTQTARHDWDLVIAGDGPLAKSLARKKAATPFAENIHLVGRKSYDELPSYYGAAGAFVLPSLVEEWGLVVNEAMAAGLPVLVSKAAGCSPDLVAHAVNGFTFDPADAKALAKRMGEISTSLRRDEMSRASRRIITDWDLQRFADGLTEAAGIAQSPYAGRRSHVGAAIIELLSRRA